ncbi:MAG: GNAT family N-acetyltransferase [Candidatus Thorarchaeota archaeon]|nr:GNAT family N-acetyltransferase [Candidatus Thorarchaeota archaeon]
MKFLSSKDPSIKSYQDAFQREIKQCQALDISYWIGVEKSNPVGFLMVGKEPIRLIAPMGTTVALLGGIASEGSSEIYYDMALKTIELVRKHDADHVFLNLNSIKYKDAITQFRNAGFSILVHSCHMQTTINDDLTHSGNLRFERIDRDGMEHFMHLMSNFMEDASDEMLRIILSNFEEFPEQMLDMLFGSDAFYFAYDDQGVVAILDICPDASDNISNIGVSPDARGRGYGRQVMLFAMEFLRKHNVKTAQVRVSLTNKPAIRLYESLGFKEIQQDTALIWWNDRNVS